MKFEYTGRHIEVTPTIRSHVEEHFERINHLFDGNNRNVHIIIEVEKGKHRSEIIVKWHDQVLTATTVNSDMYKSLSETLSILFQNMDSADDAHQTINRLGADHRVCVQN